jgi:hypothetical protein
MIFEQSDQFLKSANTFDGDLFDVAVIDNILVLLNERVLDDFSELICIFMFQRRYIFLDELRLRFWMFLDLLS